MQEKDVPQENGLNEGVREITYAVAEDGRYVLIQSAGWEPKTVVNDQAWEVISEEIMEQIQMIRAGKRSPVAYHMARNLMTPALLASYMGLFRWQVRRHLNPRVFKRLSPEILQRYADVFNISVSQLHEVPEITETGANV